MRVTRLVIQNFKGISNAQLHVDGHTLLVGPNNVGKSTVCEALELALGPERLNRNPPVGEYDFHNARYLSNDETAIPLRIEVVLTDLSAEILRRCASNLEHWKKDERRLLGEGELATVDAEGVEQCLRIQTIAQYDFDEDEFEAKSSYVHSPDTPEGELKQVPKEVKRSFGFLYLRALRTGSRALSLEKGSLLDMILRMKEARTGLWEPTRQRLRSLEPPIHEAASAITPILDAIEKRIEEYISLGGNHRSTHLFVSDLTREHLRKTVTFFLSMGPGQEPVPFHEVGTGTLNTLVLALLTFIAEIRKDNVIFAMEEPEIALPPHTQRRIANYLLGETTQCFVTSHSPYIIECFEPTQIMVLNRDTTGVLNGIPVQLPEGVKPKTYRSQLRRAVAEAILGRGVIVVEGITEQRALSVAARMFEEASEEILPLDLAGVSIVNTGGDGNLSEMGAFFKALGLRVFAFYDKRQRKAEESERILREFEIPCETPYKGMELLLVTETPVDCQWAFLEQVRDSDEDEHSDIPATRPTDGGIRDLTMSTLRKTKGEGGAGTLIGKCSVGEIPPTISSFLKLVYERFPRPRRGEPATGDAASVSTAAPAGSTNSQNQGGSA